jgi:hypothetical protein
MTVVINQRTKLYTHLFVQQHYTAHFVCSSRSVLPLSPFPYSPFSLPSLLPFTPPAISSIPLYSSFLSLLFRPFLPTIYLLSFNGGRVSPGEFLILQMLVSDIKSFFKLTYAAMWFF